MVVNFSKTFNIVVDSKEKNPKDHRAKEIFWREILHSVYLL